MFKGLDFDSFNRLWLLVISIRAFLQSHSPAVSIYSIMDLPFPAGSDSFHFCARSMTVLSMSRNFSICNTKSSKTA